MSLDFRNLFESIPGMYLVLSRDFNIVAVSNEYLKATHTNRDDIVNRSIFDVFPDSPDNNDGNTGSLRDSLNKVLETKAPNAMAVRKQLIKGAKGTEERLWSALNSPVFNGGGEMKYIIHRAEDVTEFINAKRIETKFSGEMNMQAMRGEKEVYQRAQQLEKENSQLLEAEKSKNDFFSNMAREIRTPLSLILGSLESSLAGQYGEVSEAQFQFLQTVHNNAIKLLQMANGLLDYSKFEEGKLAPHLEPTDVEALVVSVMNDFTPMMKSKKIEPSLTVTNEGKFVMMDRYLFERILFNLVSNAIKFTRTGGHVTVAVKMRDNRLKLSVDDDGVGIASANIDKLFKNYSQSSGSSTHRYEGTGLGLAMVKEFATALGGTVSVSSHLGTGSTFTVEVAAPATHAMPERAYDISQRAPLSPGYESQLTEDTAPQGDDKRHKVLVCEDNEELTVYISSLLRDFCTVRTARDGEEGLALVKSWKPDLVLSDFMMPKVNGVEMCKAIKDNPETAHIVVIMLTALTHRAAMLRGWDAKADEYLFKPFHPNELITRVKSLLAVTTDRKKANELINKKENELKGAYAEVEQLSYSATHDLLGPLHNIGGYAQMMLKDYGSKLDDEGRKNLNQIHALTMKMSDLVNNIFRFVRASHMELVKNNVDMNRLVEDVVDELKQQPGNLNTPITINNLPGANCDLHLLQQVWCNLVGNALKYTSHTDEPAIEIGSIEKDGQTVYYIKDNGAGFDMRYAHKLFLPFERLHHDSEFPGSGMGLALVKRVIERHDGRIWAESKEGKGATFYFTIGGDSQQQDTQNKTPGK